jgi:hypothetical protein
MSGSSVMVSESGVSRAAGKSGAAPVSEREPGLDLRAPEGAADRGSSNGLAAAGPAVVAPDRASRALDMSRGMRQKSTVVLETPPAVGEAWCASEAVGVAEDPASAAGHTSTGICTMNSAPAPSDDATSIAPPAYRPTRR